MLAFLYALLGFVFGYYLVVFLRRRGDSKFVAVTEYWVYVPEQKLPPQEQIMKLVVGSPAIGPAEGLIFSDIRLHIALVIKSKNPHIFRPDLFEDHIEPTPEILQGLAESQAMIKIRYLSEQKLKNDRHLQLLPYLAYAYAREAKSTVIYDVSAEHLMSVDDLVAELKKNPDATRPDLHLRAVWKRTELGGRAETRGLVKKGLPELVTGDVEGDERILVTAVMEEAAKKLWESDAVPETIEVSTFADQFRLMLAPVRNGRSEVRIMRMQTL